MTGRVIWKYDLDVQWTTGLGNSWWRHIEFLMPLDTKDVGSVVPAAAVYVDRLIASRVVGDTAGKLAGMIWGFYSSRLPMGVP
jgi:hypothetical protein